MTSEDATNLANRILAEQAELVLFIETLNVEKEPVYLFLKIRADKLPKLRKAMQKKQFQPGKFGKVLHLGKGKVTPDVIEKMKQEYGFNAEAMVALPTD